MPPSMGIIYSSQPHSLVCTLYACTYYPPQAIVTLETSQASPRPLQAR